MKTKVSTYTTDYGEYDVTYSIVSDVDGNTAMIKNIEGITDFEFFFDKGTLDDMKFICECDFQDKQLHHYMKTGETL